MTSSSSQPDQQDLKRLQQMERELERSQFQARPEPEAATPAVTPKGEIQSWGWGKTLGAFALAGLGLVMLGWILNIVGALIKLGLLVGIGYLVYRFVVAPRFRGRSSSK